MNLIQRLQASFYLPVNPLVLHEMRQSHAQSARRRHADDLFIDRQRYYAADISGYFFKRDNGVNGQQPGRHCPVFISSVGMQTVLVSFVLAIIHCWSTER